MNTSDGVMPSVEGSSINVLHQIRHENTANRQPRTKRIVRHPLNVSSKSTDPNIYAIRLLSPSSKNHEIANSLYSNLQKTPRFRFPWMHFLISQFTPTNPNPIPHSIEDQDDATTAPFKTTFSSATLCTAKPSLNFFVTTSGSGSSLPTNVQLSSVPSSSPVSAWAFLPALRLIRLLAYSRSRYMH